MAEYSEDTLNNWRKPPSDTEESKLTNAEKLVKDAIKANNQLKDLEIKIFGQESYANDTKVRLNGG